MRFDEGDKIARFNQFYPNTVVLIGTAGKDRLNVMPAAWHTALSRDPLLYGVLVSPRRYTYSVIKESGEFTLNFAPAGMFDLVKKTGNVSGWDVDKFRVFGIASEPGKLVRAPILKGAYSTYECKVFGVHPAGDHDLVVGKVVGVHTDTAVFREDGVLRLSDFNIVLYMGAYTYATLDGSTKVRTEK